MTGSTFEKGLKKKITTPPLKNDCLKENRTDTHFFAQLKSKVGLALPKAAVLRITFNLDGVPITSTSHTHPSHSQTSRLLTSSLSLGVPVPRGTQCM